MRFEVGTKVRIDRCEVCPAVVGKTVTVKSVYADGENLIINYGRGRPSADRPSFVNVDDVSLVKEVEV